MKRKIRLILMGLGIVVLVVLCWFLLLNPIRGDIAEKEASIETERSKLAVAQAKLAQAEITREEGKRNQARLLELAKMVPESDEIPSLLLQIQDLADQSGIDFISITPGSLVEGVSFRILPLELEFSGTYFDLSDFVYRAEQMVAGPGRLLAVKTLDLQLRGEALSALGSSAAVSPTLTVNMTLYAFDSAASVNDTGTTAPQTSQPVNPTEPSASSAGIADSSGGSF